MYTHIWRITRDDYDKKHKEFKDRQYEIGLQLEEYTKADEDFSLTVSQVFSLAQRAKEVFISSEIPEKRQLLNYLLQNCELNGKKLEFTLRKPFDAIVNYAKCPTVLRHLESHKFSYPRKFLKPLGFSISATGKHLFSRPLSGSNPVSKKQTKNTNQISVFCLVLRHLDSNQEPAPYICPKVSYRDGLYHHPLGMRGASSDLMSGYSLSR